MDWREEYKRRLTSAEELVEAVQGKVILSWARGVLARARRRVR